MGVRKDDAACGPNYFQPGTSQSNGATLSVVPPRLETFAAPQYLPASHWISRSMKGPSESLTYGLRRIQGGTYKAKEEETRK
jgi:hypothetical protein